MHTKEEVRARNLPKIRAAEAELPEGKARDLLREALETYAAMTTEDFGLGVDRAIREKIARFLGLNPADYCLYTTLSLSTLVAVCQDARTRRNAHGMRGGIPE